MSQHDMNIANQGFPAFRSDLNNALSAIQTNHSGTSRPTGAVAGQIWLDTTSATSPTLKFFDGTDDISLATIDYSANTVNWLDSTVSITGLTSTASGTVLTLQDTNVEVSGGSTQGGEVRFKEDSDTGSNYTALKAGNPASNVTFILPIADGSADQILKTDGSGNLSFADASGGGTSWQSSIVTGTTLSAVAGNGYWIDTTSNACTVTLPASASVGDTIEFVDYARNWATNNVTINPNSLNFQGNSSPNPVYDVNGQSVRIVYSGATQGWIPLVDDDVTFETPQTYSVDFLVIAGGAGGGAGENTSALRCGGGGGAGGYRASYNSETSGGGGSSESSLTFNGGTVYTITVGAGGAGATTASGSGNSGSDSSISGSDITTITSAGGGGGGGDQTNGTNGGSGGGGGASSSSTSGGTGTSNQGFAGGAGGSNTGGGGGGSGSVGGDRSASELGGNGGSGVASTITGSSVSRAGGGGGGDFNTPSGGTATAGGGAGGNDEQNGTAGTVNTGGGGGGGGQIGSSTVRNGGNGGSGVVILRLPTANYSGTTSGSPTVTTDGTDTILTFTGSGSYTA